MSTEYHKINSIWKRDENGKIIRGDFSCPEYEYLFDSKWTGTEKVDGTNIRVEYLPETGIMLGGRTDKAQIPAKLVTKLYETFATTAMLGRLFAEFPDGCTLYGEGYGAGIQKGGGAYNPNGVDFVLFDVRVGKWWLRRESVLAVAASLGIRAVPEILSGATLREAEAVVMSGALVSEWGNFHPEGLVLVPDCELLNRSGERIIVKIKGRDYI